MSKLARQIDRCFAQPRASWLISIYVLRIRSADHKANPYHKDASKNLNAMRASSELTNVPSRPHHEWKAGYINHFLSRQYVGIWALRVISLQRSNSVAFRAKRTSTQSGDSTGFMSTHSMNRATWEFVLATNHAADSRRADQRLASLLRDRLRTSRESSCDILSDLCWNSVAAATAGMPMGR